MSDQELLWLSEQSAKCDVVLELGSWKGRSTVAMALNARRCCISIDTFNGSKDKDGNWDGGHEEALLDGGDRIYTQFMRNTWDLQCAGKLISFRCRGESGAALVRDLWQKVDCAFIDAAHNADDVFRDIELFRPLVRSGGILCGHDWFWSGLQSGIERAGVRNPQLCDSIWWITV